MPSMFGYVSLALGLAFKASALDLDLARFVTAKETQARNFAEAQSSKVPSIVWSFFDAVRVDDWETATNLAARLQDASGRSSYADTNSVSPALQTPIWQTISETLGAYEQFHDWDNKWLHRFGRDIMESIPKGSIYFGGTDPGRFVISALSESHREGRPFFTLTQNQLVDRTYLDYLREMYGGKIAIPTMEDYRSAFDEYVTSAQQRLKSGTLKPGENIRVVEGRLQVSGQVAVMEINGLLARVIVQKNPGRQCYVEESFPLDWMYPHLSPHGPILELHREPLSGLREAEVQKNNDYWKQLVGELIGDWITDKTSVREVCNFCRKVYLQKDLAGFNGDTGFARNDEAQKTFSKLRSSIAGLYVWRAEHAAGEDEKDRMNKTAELACKQAVALCPCSPEAVFRYCNLLVSHRRNDDAILVAESCMRMEPDNAQVRELVRSLRKAE